MSTYLITGASRGLGLGFCTALAAKPTSQVSTILAAARSETDELKALIEANPDRVILIKMDVTVKDTIAQAAQKATGYLTGRGLDVLVNNAGVMPDTPNGVATM